MNTTRGRSFRRLSRAWYLGCRLLDAMKFGRWKNVKALTKIHDLDPNIIVPEYGIAPMHCAAGIEPEDFGLNCVREFLKIGGDPNVKCSEGVTPVHVASCWGRLNVLKILLSRGGNPYLIDYEGNDAFFYAQGNEKVLQILSSCQISDKENGTNDVTEYDKNAFLLDSEEINDNSEDKNGDLDLNYTALSLMTKHRQSVFIFESQSDEDSSSSTTLDVEFTEDYAFNPYGVDSEGLIENNHKATINAPFNKENWNDPQKEIYIENIMEADKTFVINAINDNVNKSLNSDANRDFKQFEEKEAVDQLINNAETTPHNADKSKQDQIELAVDRFNNLNTNCSKSHVTSSINFFQPLTNELTDGSIAVVSEPNRKSSNSVIKKSSLSSLTSNLEESNYETPLTSKEIKKSDDTSTIESISSSSNNYSIPKSVRDKLTSFKINTYYKKKTRVLRMVSKSSDALLSKKSLYLSSFEYWSTKIRSKSYPCYTKPRKLYENINS